MDGVRDGWKISDGGVEMEDSVTLRAVVRCAATGGAGLARRSRQGGPGRDVK